MTLLTTHGLQSSLIKLLVNIGTAKAMVIPASFYIS